MVSEFRKSFYHQGVRLFSYPLHCESEGDQIATVQTLAYQRKCSPDDIEVYLEECAPKRWDFSRDCAVERISEPGRDERWRILVITNGRMYTHKGPLSNFIMMYEAGEA